MYPSPPYTRYPKMISRRKKRPQHLARSLKLIEEERVNVARRTRERIGLLFTETDNGLDLDIATTTEIPMR